MRYIVLFIVSLSWMARGEEPSKDAKPPEPKSPSARLALDEYTKSLQLADNAWKSAAIKATEKTISALEASKREAMQHSNLDEAVIIDQKVKDLRGWIVYLNTPPKVEKPATQTSIFTDEPKLLPIEGKWNHKLSIGWETDISIKANVITQLKPGNSVTFERKGNEIRIVWEDGNRSRYVFNGNTFVSETWRVNNKPYFTGKPSFTGEGKKIE
jgi:hypothetical protein